MINKLLLSSIFILFLFHPSIISAQDIENVEIFDIEKSEVIQLIPTNSNIQIEAKKIVNSINDIERRVKPIPNKGYMIKVPLAPSLLVDNQWVYAQIDEVIIIIPEDGEPSLLLFDEENNSHFFTFETTIDSLLDTLDFTL